ncbi:peptidase M12 [Sphingomonas bacterium]|uniref:peptidase M12 n=1 Tax=Sphingomonas bacterium TaxID=1895847 RepID=UPI00157743D3|nr:peptidase M12 [Sphingomonas bacterium]
MSTPPTTHHDAHSTAGHEPLIACSPRHLPDDLLIASGRVARRENPRNHPIAINRLKTLDPSFQITAEHIAVLATKFWRTKGLRLTVGFIDTPDKGLPERILGHMNAWSDTADVTFVLYTADEQARQRAAGTDTGEAQVRIALKKGDGHWSYLGTDILLAQPGQPTMNLDGFSMTTAESEFFRVVRHETGHTLGCPHEHMRKDLIDDIDPAKAIPFYEQSQGWTRDQVVQQILTPISEGSLWGTGAADGHSIMCYQIPGSLTLSGNPIPGGTDIDASDRAFIALVYPKGAGNVANPPATTAVTAVTAAHDTTAAPERASAPVDPIANADAAHRSQHRDCVEVELKGGVRLNVQPGATGDQIKRVVDALGV